MYVGIFDGFTNMTRKKGFKPQLHPAYHSGSYSLSIDGIGFAIKWQNIYTSNFEESTKRPSPPKPPFFHLAFEPILFRSMSI